VSGACFICDQQANDVLVISRLDRTAYDVPMCEACLIETDVLSRSIRWAHELIDVRNEYRTHHRLKPG
jgi:hypothetical protein